MARAWTDEQLAGAVVRACTMAEVCEILGLAKSGAQYRHLRKHIQRLGLPIAHWVFARSGGIRRLTPEDVFVKGRHTSGHAVRDFYRRRSEYRCAICGNIGEHSGRPLTLQLDHVDGDRSNNILGNLRWLCPNCHSQTPTWGTKRSRVVSAVVTCEACGQEFRGVCTRRVCSRRCAGRLLGRVATHATKIEWPEATVLAAMCVARGFLHTGRMLGVSDNAVRKHLKRCGAGVD